MTTSQEKVSIRNSQSVMCSVIGIFMLIASIIVALATVTGMLGTETK